MTKIFLIAGMGADTRVFNNIELPDNYDVIPVDWIEPNFSDTLETYAQKLIHQYEIRPNSIIIGNSLGGMLAVEIANKIRIKKTILISSIKTIDEAPSYFKMFSKLPVYKLVPNSLLNSMGFMIEILFGKMKAEDKWLFKDMLKNTSPVFLKWSMGAVLKWQNMTIPPNVFHITGDKDLIFNYKRIKNAVIVKGGTHIMVLDRAKEINKWLKPILKK